MKSPPPYKRRQFLQLMLLGTGSMVAAWSCSSREEKANSADVLIIGAGIAGIAAARYLQEQGISVTILEGRDRIGGRIWSDNSLGIPLDLGATWIYGIKENPLTPLVEDFRLQTVPTNYDSLQLYLDGEALDSKLVAQGEDLYQEIKAAAKEIAEQLEEDISVRVGMQKVLADKELSYQAYQTLEWWLSSEVAIELGVDLEQLSLWEWEEDKAFPGDDHLFPGGYDQLIANLGERLDIRLREKAIEISYGYEGVLVTTDKNSFTADATLITVPLGVLKAGQIQFFPPLPEAKEEAIRDLSMGVLNKVAVLFPEKFWDNEEIIGAVSKITTDFPYFLNYAHYQAEPILMALVGGSFASRLEDLSPGELEAEILSGLQRMYGDNLPPPEKIISTSWGSDPFAFGAYSHLPVGVTSKARKILAKTVDKTLFFAGEATSVDYPGTVHGAYLSGIAAAKRLLANAENLKRV